jgi:hypothetical protein
VLFHPFGSPIRSYSAAPSLPIKVYSVAHSTCALPHSMLSLKRRSTPRLFDATRYRSILQALSTSKTLSFDGGGVCVSSSLTSGAMSDAMVPKLARLLSFPENILPGNLSDLLLSRTAVVLAGGFGRLVADGDLKHAAQGQSEGLACGCDIGLVGPGSANMSSLGQKGIIGELLVLFEVEDRVSPWIDREREGRKSWPIRILCYKHRRLDAV